MNKTIAFKIRTYGDTWSLGYSVGQGGDLLDSHRYDLENSTPSPAEISSFKQDVDNLIEPDMRVVVVYDMRKKDKPDGCQSLIDYVWNKAMERCDHVRGTEYRETKRRAGPDPLKHVDSPIVDRPSATAAVITDWYRVPENDFSLGNPRVETCRLKQDEHTPDGSWYDLLALPADVLVVDCEICGLTHKNQRCHVCKVAHRLTVLEKEAL